MPKSLTSREVLTPGLRVPSEGRVRWLGPELLWEADLHTETSHMKVCDFQDWA